MSINDNITGFAPAGQITPDPENTIDAPNTLTPDASTPIGTPDTVTPVGAGSITAPNTINPDAVNAVDAPNTLTPDAVNNVDTPNTLAPDAVNPIATPVGFAPLNSEPINRVLTPLIGLNFGSQNYSVMGQPSTFTDALTYSRASSATYVETYVDALNRKQKRITTVGANVPRFEDAGLLVEGASTNLMLRSEEFDDVHYAKTRATVSANSSLSPDGSFSADKLVEDSSLGSHIIIANATIGTSTIYTFSVYVKSAGRNYVRLTESFDATRSAYFNVANGTIGTIGVNLENATIENVGGGWYRCSIYIDAGIGGTKDVRVYLAEDNDIISYQGNGSNGVLLWGAQVEALPFATSYIKTEGAVVSRAADVCSAPVSVSGGNYTVEAIGKDVALPTTQSIMCLNIGNGTASLASAYVETSNNRVRAFLALSGSTQFNFVDANNTWDVEHTLSANFTNGSAQAFTDGESIGSDLSVSIPTYDTLYIGTLNGSALPFYGNIKRIEIYDTVLTANEVKSL